MKPMVTVYFALTLVNAFFASSHSIAQIQNLTIYQSFNTVSLTYDSRPNATSAPSFTDQIEVRVDGVVAMPMQLNPVTSLHNSVIFAEESTPLNVEIRLPNSSTWQGCNTSTRATQSRPGRASVIQVNDMNGFVDALENCGNDTEIVLNPGDYSGFDLGQIQVIGKSKISIIGNGQVIDGSSKNSTWNPTWSYVGNDIYQLDNADPDYRMLSFGDTLVQHVGTINEPSDLARTPAYFWATSPERTTWWVKLDGANPNDTPLTQLSLFHGIKFFDCHDVWIEDLTIKELGKSENTINHTQDNRALTFSVSSNIRIQSSNFEKVHGNAIILSTGVSDVIIDDCSFEYKLRDTHNRDYLKPIVATPEMDFPIRFGYEAATSILVTPNSSVKPEGIVIRNSNFNQLGNCIHFRSCSHCDAHDNWFTDVHEEILTAIGDAQQIRFWRNQADELTLTGFFDMNSSTGPVWYVDNFARTTQTWFPHDADPGFYPMRDNGNHGHGDSLFKFNFGSGVELLGECFFYNNTGIMDLETQSRWADLKSRSEVDPKYDTNLENFWDGRNYAFSLSGEQHLMTTTRHNIWYSSGKGIASTGSNNNLDMEYDQVFSENLQNFGTWRHNYEGSTISTLGEVAENFGIYSANLTNSSGERSPQYLDPVFFPVDSGIPTDIAPLDPSGIPGISNNSYFDLNERMGSSLFLSGAGLDTASGSLSIVGSEYDDDIVVSVDGAGYLEVEVNGKSSCYEKSMVSDVVIDANGGDDRIVIMNGSAGSYLIYGRGGDDHITVGNLESNDVTVFSGDGDDEIEINNTFGSLRLAGGNGSDTITGSPGNDDLIQAGSGNDTILGRGGNDRIFGQSGIDIISGGPGDDLLHGGNNNDVISGGSGNDEIFGGPHDDVVYGNSGDDIVFGDSNPNDSFNDDNNPGNDDISGGNGNDEVYGGDGNDILRGDFGSDLLDGGNDDDSASDCGEDAHLSIELGADCGG